MKKIVLLTIMFMQVSAFAIEDIENLKETSQNVVLLENLPNESITPSWQVHMGMGSKDLNNLKSSNNNYKFKYPETVSAYLVEFGVDKPLTENWFVNSSVGYSSVDLPVSTKSKGGKLQLHLIPINLGLSYVFMNLPFVKPILKVGMSYNIVSQTGDSDGSEFFKNTSMGFYEVGLVYVFDKSKNSISGTYQNMKMIGDSSVEFSSDSLLLSYNITM